VNVSIKLQRSVVQQESGTHKSNFTFPHSHTTVEASEDLEPARPSISPCLLQGRSQGTSWGWGQELHLWEAGGTKDWDWSLEKWTRMG
jgi:hypothetical protein